MRAADGHRAADGRRRTGRALTSARALLLALAGGVGGLASPPVSGQQPAAGPPGGDLRDEGGFLRAGPGRPIVLPADHGSHPETRTEWWYVTGPLVGAGGERFAFQATWFRQALIHAQPEGRSPLAVRDVLLHHGVVAAMSSGERRFTEQGSRAFPGWSHAAEGRLDVAVFGQRLQDASGAGESATLELVAGDWELSLELQLSSCAPLLHGAEPGLSVKGSAPGEASWYYSLPAVEVQGELRRAGRPALPVGGQVWFDHEFGSSQLAAGQEGWDWFSVALDDGSDLMLYQMRREGGASDVTSAGTLRTDDGTRRHLGHGEFVITSTGSWTSPTSGTRYPAGWTLAIPSAALELRVTPVRADQELETPRTTGVTYWEGLCVFEGTRAGRPVRGEGYVELVGYGESVARRFLGGIEASGARP